MSNVVRATSVSSWLSDALADAAHGVVLALFGRSAYLDLDGRIVALASMEFGGGPLTITLDRFDALRPLAVGDAVSLNAGTLRVGPHAISLVDAAIWDPALPPVERGRAGGSASRDLVIRELRSAAPGDSIAALLDEPTEHPAAEAVTLGGLPAAAAPPAALLDPLRRGLWVIAEFLEGRADARTAARAVASEIAGRGRGLTPSGDDLLVGIMHAITIWPQVAAGAGEPDVRRLLADAAAPKTTRISAAYLDAAARGYAGERWHALVRGLGRSLPAARGAARRVLAVGETSGADALTGFCWAWRRLDS